MFAALCVQSKCVCVCVCFTQGMADILRDEDTIFGDSGPESLGGPLDDTASMGITIDHIEARMLNRTAGMRLAYEVRGRPTLSLSHTHTHRFSTSSRALYRPWRVH